MLRALHHKFLRSAAAEGSSVEISDDITDTAEIGVANVSTAVILLQRKARSFLKTKENAKNNAARHIQFSWRKEMRRRRHAVAKIASASIKLQGLVRRQQAMRVMLQRRDSVHTAPSRLIRLRAQMAGAMKLACGADRRAPYLNDGAIPNKNADVPCTESDEVLNPQLVYAANMIVNNRVAYVTASDDASTGSLYIGVQFYTGNRERFTVRVDESDWAALGYGPLESLDQAQKISLSHELCGQEMYV